MNRDTEIAKEIIAISIIGNKTIKEIFDEFYTIMRKYNIKQGVFNETKTSRTITNPEWTLYEALFFNTIQSALVMNLEWGLSDETLAIPEDLEA